MNGKKIALADLLYGLTDGIAKLRAAGVLTDEIVPDHERVFPKWAALLDAVREGDVTTCARNLDWALKFLIIDREISASGHALGSPEIRLVDQLYSHVDKEIGLYWAFERSGFAERCVSEEEIARMQRSGPGDTRAYTRNRILEKFGSDVVSVDWGEIRVRVPEEDGRWTVEKRIVLDNPAAFTKAGMEGILNASSSIRAFCEALEDAEKRRGPSGPGAVLQPGLRRSRHRGVQRRLGSGARLSGPSVTGVLEIERRRTRTMSEHEIRMDMSGGAGSGGPEPDGPNVETSARLPAGCGGVQ